MFRMIDSYDPYSGEYLGSVQVTEKEETAKIVRDSKKAQAEWAALSFDERAAILSEAGSALEKRAEKIAKLLCREMGKGWNAGYGEVIGCARSVDYVVKRVGEAIRPVRLDYGDSIVTTEYLPRGICAIIAPWNYPVSMAHWMIIPALAAGNSVILKPSEETPLVAKEYVKTLNRVLPEGLLQLVNGGKEQSEELIASDIDLIGFTGSMEAGRDILKSAAERFIPCIMELGGKDPLIVLPDADIEAAASFAVSNALANSGQMCISTERIYVHRSIYDEFNRMAAEYLKYFRMGPWDDRRANIGPMINERQRQKVLGHVEDAAFHGARIIAGAEESPDRFVRPMVICDCSSDMKIFKEETFGPVVCTCPYDDTDEAIAMANDSPYGLGAVVFGYEDAEYVSSGLDAGMVGINCGSTGGVDVPWTGTKGSAYGYHGSPDGHRQFTKPKVINRRK